MIRVTGRMDTDGYVVEHEGMLRTGPFESADDAKRWYRDELELELELKVEEVSK